MKNVFFGTLDQDAIWLDWPDYYYYDYYYDETALAFGSLECLDELDWVCRDDIYISFSI